MTLLADFGNTRVKVSLWNGVSLDGIYSGPVVIEDLKDAVGGIRVEGGMWCAVHPLPPNLVQWLGTLGLVPLTHQTRIPLINSYSTPETLGMDRLAAAVGAWSLNPGHDMLVIDAGTALTVDFISADGVYRGGNIAPGIELRFKALHEHTAVLPQVSPKGLVLDLGQDTVSAIRSGVLNGIRHEVRGYIDEFARLYPSLLVFLTGGDAEFFDIKGKSSIFAVPDLVLKGLARIFDYNEKGF